LFRYCSIVNRILFRFADRMAMGEKHV
jgi:hypothetical protein